MPLPGAELPKPLEFLREERVKGVFCHVKGPQCGSGGGGRDKGLLGWGLVVREPTK